MLYRSFFVEQTFIYANENKSCIKGYSLLMNVTL